MLHCLHRVLWLEFSVWGSSDKPSVAPIPKKNNLASSVPKILCHVSLGQSTCSLENCNLFMFSTNLDDVSYDRLIWKRCDVALEGSRPGDKLLNVTVYLMTVKKIHVWLYVAVLTCIECFLFCIQ